MRRETRKWEIKSSYRFAGLLLVAVGLCLLVLLGLALGWVYKTMADPVAFWGAFVIMVISLFGGARLISTKPRRRRPVSRSRQSLVVVEGGSDARRDGDQFPDHVVRGLKRGRIVDLMRYAAELARRRRGVEDDGDDKGPKRAA